MHVPPPLSRDPALARYPVHPDQLDRTKLLAVVEATWALTDWLFSSVADDALLHESPDPLRNPLVFYLAHPAAFYVNKLRLAGLLAEPVDPGLDSLFAKGVDPESAAALDRGAAYPSADVTRAYRAACRARVVEVVQRSSLGDGGWSSPAWALWMGIEHERIHFETSSVLLRQAPLHRLRAPVGWRRAESEGEAPPNEPIEMPGGRVRLGRGPQSETFGWDNEYGEVEVDVAPFRVSRQLVSNGELLRFVEAGGYDREALWEADGWAWRTGEQRSSPRFWRRDETRWLLRTVFAEVPLPLDWPAEVNAFEASAYCRWVGARLPTEAEQAMLTQDAARARGDAAFHQDHHLHLATCSPRPVHAGRPTPRGLHDPFGNVWQWLSDRFRPLPGFREHPLYADFSSPYFDDDHWMLLGGSWASLGNSASQYYRLWFRPFFYQHAGFRLVWDR